MKWLLILFSCSSLFATTEIVFWHSFEGFMCEKFTEIVEDFNAQSRDCRVVLVYKGNYWETYQKGMAAAREGNGPHILQVYEVATQTMMNSELVVPLEEVMQGRRFDSDVYIDVIKEFFSNGEGVMCSLPWNVSTGILFYNKKAFAEAGLDRPPETWEELEEFGGKLVAAGYYGFTTAWPAAYHLEYICTWHELPLATMENGFGGDDARLCFNGPYQIRHWEKLVQWQKQGIFSYQGRFTDKPEQLFNEGKCAILLQGSNRFPLLKCSDLIGVGFMPYWSDIAGAPHRLHIGGTSFWAMAGFEKEVYCGIAQFFSYLSLTETQNYWHQQTGFLPITEATYYLAKKKKFYEKNPAAEIAVLEVLHREVSPYTKGFRLPNYPQIREKIIDSLEKALQGELTSKEALDRAVEEGNEILSKK